MKYVTVWITFVVLSFVTIVHAESANEQEIVFIDSPNLIATSIPFLNGVRYTKSTFKQQLLIPGIGSKNVVTPYFEMEFNPREFGLISFAVTLVQAVEEETLLVGVATQKEPDNVTLSNESVNAHLPQWLIEEGVDMHHVYTLPIGEYQFLWHDQLWSFDQLTELLSSVVSAQALPGKYMNPGAKARICDGIGEVEMDGHNVYGMLLHAIRDSECNLVSMHTLAGEALLSFMEQAPQIQ